MSVFGDRGVRVDIPVTAEGDSLGCGSDAKVTFWSARLGQLHKLRLRYGDVPPSPILPNNQPP
jgi:hypothetical protein